jgi:tRNA dimethylallyltransferase
MAALGYLQIAEYLEGKKDLDETKSEIKKLTRNYAKRQLTWMRGIKEAKWLDITGMSGEEVVESICGYFNEKKGG